MSDTPEKQTDSGSGVWGFKVSNRLPQTYLFIHQIENTKSTVHNVLPKLVFGLELSSGEIGGSCHIVLHDGVVPDVPLKSHTMRFEIVLTSTPDTNVTKKVVHCAGYTG